MELFNLTKYAGRKKIKDRGISWKETYKEKSVKFKEKFDKLIGEGAYRRWEGHDYTTNSDYYVVVGPTTQKQLGKCFFAGIKKLPPDHDKKVYCPSGKYFVNIISAYSYASEKWGVMFPTGQTNYTKELLTNIKIPEHIRA